ncbi:MAG: MarR family transcriptional regulator [Anaerovorax sp.]
MGKKSEVLDAIQRLGRNIKRYSTNSNGDAHGRGQGKTLRLIAQNQGIRANELAKLLDIRPSSLTQKLDKLEADGNIARVRDRRDARVVKLYLTEEGERTLAFRQKEREKITKDFSDCLSKEEKQLFCSLCDRLSQNFEEMREEEKRQQEYILHLKKEEEEENVDFGRKEIRETG